MAVFTILCQFDLGACVRGCVLTYGSDVLVLRVEVKVGPQAELYFAW